MSSCLNATIDETDVGNPGVPSGTRYVATQYTNESLHAMSECCGPKPVQRSGVKGCIVWCELSDELVEVAESDVPVTAYMYDCMEKQFPDVNFGNIAADTSSSSTLRPPSLKGFALAALVIAVAICR